MGLAIICLPLFSFGHVPGLGCSGSVQFASLATFFFGLGTLGGTTAFVPGWLARADFAAVSVVCAPSPLFFPSASHGSLQ